MTKLLGVCTLPSLWMETSLVLFGEVLIDLSVGPWNPGAEQRDPKAPSRSQTDGCPRDGTVTVRHLEVTVGVFLPRPWVPVLQSHLDRLRPFTLFYTFCPYFRPFQLSRVDQPGRLCTHERVNMRGSQDHEVPGPTPSTYGSFHWRTDWGSLFHLFQLRRVSYFTCQCPL